MSRLHEQLARRVLFFDGAMGTSIHRLDLDLQRDYLGRENCTEAVVLANPGVIEGIHRSFLEAGADIVETDTFNANVITMADQDLADRVHEINLKAARVARNACNAFTTAERPRFVAGSMGPGTRLITLGNTHWDEMLASYAEQARGLIDGGVDVFLIETAQDILQVKCAINACLTALRERGKTTDDIPIMVQVTIESTGTMLLGTEIAGAAAALAGFPILSLGLNCATGPTEMAEHIRYLGKAWPKLISLQPNAGLPLLVDNKTEFPLKPAPFAQAVKQYVEECGINMVGGCCGTTPEHIRAVVEAVGMRPPRRTTMTDKESGTASDRRESAVSGDVPESNEDTADSLRSLAVPLLKSPLKPSCTSLYGPVEYRQDASILNVGERTNASGSRAFKKMLETEDWDAMVSLAKDQAREGSHILDVNVDYAGRDNARDMAELVKRFVRQVSMPLMLDSTQPATIEAGLKAAGGKCIINSANLEDGEEKFARMCTLARTYGTALVLGTIDEDKQEAMARTADRKIAIARRLRDLAMNHHGLAEGDLFFDPLVLPISTGMEKDRRSALETIEGVRRIAAEFPACQITCGLSNVSFGLKPAARVVLNSAFLFELVKAGLTSAIVHVSKILPESRIPPEQWAAAMEVIYDRRAPGTGKADPLQAFIGLFPDDAATTGPAKKPQKDLTLEERLRAHIVDGEKRDLVATLDEARKKYTPLAIINDHLLDGMKTVGELFGSGRMQLPFVLQSAEVMKMAVAHLEQFMEKVAGQTKGTIVLATVKGDVHDIGKNLVDIILSNNGYTVHNLGIKQPIADIIQKWKATGAQAIGLSGLLVKSVVVMRENLDELNRQEIRVPLLLGGAALSRHYCESDLRGAYRGHLYYGRDAFEGLRLMDHIVHGKEESLNVEIQERLTKRAAVEAKIEASHVAAAATATAVVDPTPAPIAQVKIPAPPFWGSRAVESIRLDDVYPFINRVALFRGQWQFKKGQLGDAEYEEQVRDEIEPLFSQLKQKCKDERILQPKVVYGYFPCNSSGDDLIIYDPQNPHGDHEGDSPRREIERFSFPRQPSRKRLCISSFFRPVESGVTDVLGLLCVTMGSEASVRSRQLFEKNQYKDYLYLHGLSVEATEGLAEMWHKRMRQELGIAGEDAANIRDLFTQTYRGSRYSFGYPACPDMGDQEKLFRLLEPSRIGCTLTENFQIDPEQSTSAIVVHHPEARYFAV